MSGNLVSRSCKLGRLIQPCLATSSFVETGSRGRSKGLESLGVKGCRHSSWPQLRLQAPLVNVASQIISKFTCREFNNTEVSSGVEGVRKDVSLGMLNLGSVRETKEDTSLGDAVGSKVLNTRRPRAAC